MKKTKLISTPEPIKAEEPIVKIESLSIEKCGHSFRDMANCLISNIDKIRFDYIEKEKEAHSPLEYLDFYSEMKKYVKFILTFLKPEIIALIDVHISHFERIVEKEKEDNNKKGKTFSNDVLRQDIRRNKVAINSGSMVFGEFIGNMVEHMKNKDGNRMIEVEDHKLAQMLSLGCVLIGGKPLNISSLAVYIGKGRKLKSIIDKEALDAFFNKQD